MSGRRDGTGRAALLVALVTALVGPLVGCGGGGTSSGVTAAPGATAPACGTALAAAPSSVSGLTRTPLSVPGALSWGEPAVILRCGLPAQAPTTKPCLGVDGVDWVVDAESDPFVFVSYGRDPAVELRVPASYGRDDAVAAVTDVGPVAAALPSNGRRCVGADDVTTPSTTSSTTPAGTTPTVSASRSGG